MSAVSLLYRYADFVAVHGGSELQLGIIVGLGAIGAVLVRILQGSAMDRVGTKVVWLSSLLLLIVGCLSHTMITNVVGWQVFLARFCLASGIAGALGSWLTFASLRVPKHRVAEMIGVVGSSGFIGMAIGPTIGDLLMGTSQPQIADVNKMFFAAAGLGFVSMVCAWGAHHGLQFAVPTSMERPWTVIKQYRPGFLLVVAITMGIGGSIPSTYVRPWAKSLDANSIAIYFWVYNSVAFGCRIVFSQMFQRFGLRKMTVVGLAALILSLILYVTVPSQQWIFVPAVLAGLSHAFLFPAVMAAGLSSFPDRHRGLAINFMFSIYDMGLLIGAPLVGTLLWGSAKLGFSPYPTTFLILAVWVASVLLLYKIVTDAPKRATQIADHA